LSTSLDFSQLTKKFRRKYHQRIFFGLSPEFFPSILTFCEQFDESGAQEEEENVLVG
jgi:hypothetical protein